MGDVWWRGLTLIDAARRADGFGHGDMRLDNICFPMGRAGHIA